MARHHRIAYAVVRSLLRLAVLLLPPELRGVHAGDVPDAQVQLPGRHVSHGQMEQ